jgi:DNA-binding NarL/FixJ family response regulator
VSPQVFYDRVQKEGKFDSLLSPTLETEFNPARSELTGDAKERPMIYRGTQSPLATNVRPHSRRKTYLNTAPDLLNLHSEPEAEPAPQLKTTVHFEWSDEDAHIFNRVAELLGHHEICRVRTREEVYKSLFVAVPSQIVINCASSRKEGFQLLEDLREISRLDDVPVIILSDRPDEGTIRLAFALGATRYFIRPLLLEQYKRCISGILSETQVLEPGIAAFEKFRPPENGMLAKPSRLPKPLQTYSLITEKQSLKRYPWVYSGI